MLLDRGENKVFLLIILLYVTIALVSPYQPFILQLVSPPLMSLPFHSFKGILQLHTSLSSVHFHIHHPLYLPFRGSGCTC